jgi:putative intracellular protease/amidase
MSKGIFTLLIVITSHDQLGDTGEKTGFWLEEFTTPYYIFLDAGVKVSLASPRGGMPPIDPRSMSDEAQTDSTRRFLSDNKANEALANTIKLSQVNANDFDAIFYPGGHGPLWDLVDNKDSIRLIESFWSQGKPVSAVCHAPAVLLNARDNQGELIIKNKNVTGFTNNEETAIGLTNKVPFLLESELIERGGSYSKADNFEPHIQIDGKLITGQNPASAEGVAKALIEMIQSE